MAIILLSQAFCLDGRLVENVVASRNEVVAIAKLIYSKIAIVCGLSDFDKRWLLDLEWIV